MTRGIRGFVEIDHARADEGFEIAFEWSTSYGNRSKMSCTDEESVIVLEKQWPIASVHRRCDSFWFDGIVDFLATFGKDDCHFGKRRYRA